MKKITYANKIFGNYRYICVTISMLETTLSNYNYTDEEISALSLSHSVGGVDYGKSSVRQISQKTAEIALSGENKLSKEKLSVISKINFYKKVKTQIDCFVNTYLDDLSRDIWKSKFLNRKSVFEIAEELKLSDRTVSRKIKAFEEEFEEICMLSYDEIEKMLADIRRK